MVLLTMALLTMALLTMAGSQRGNVRLYSPLPYLLRQGHSAVTYGARALLTFGGDEAGALSADL